MIVGLPLGHSRGVGDYRGRSWRDYLMVEDTGDPRSIARGPRFDCERDVVGGNSKWFLARMYARFLGGPAMQGSWFRCGISPGLARFTAVWSLNRPPAARAPLLGGGPARRQPLPPQGADATTLMSLRPVKVLESLGLIFLDGHCWPGASLSAKAPRNWLAAAFRPLPRPEVRAGLESLLRYETVEESLK